ncbi:Nucleotidyltransferase domain-containing protein [Halogranum amylolyticum]|uniref:Nucleotidyltransferase domain-containing protein n=1 Tax=Halogranum amylolyticum TaxID=660520 RepID=A0A1H8VP76_9EURY|nr:nucleotidyltransferase domain-containing protein [Halogranum amylolyticum]SEP17216.1 Nucleotidyltransferase domain-containing protein [Halogranum amylolyticum]
MSNETANGSTSANAHAVAAEAFVDQARSQHGDEIAELYVFGSTVRGETRGLASDVDVLVVLGDDTNQDIIADSLRDLAYDVMLEYGPVVELHILSETAFERHQHEGNPFIRSVVTGGRSYA